MGSGTIGAATEREHGIVGVMSYVCVHQCSACLAENFGLRQLQQLATISRPLLFCRTTIPGQVRRFGFKSFRQNIRVFLHNFVYISCRPRIVTFACQRICISYATDCYTPFGVCISYALSVPHANCHVLRIWKREVAGK